MCWLGVVWILVLAGLVVVAAVMVSSHDECMSGLLRTCGSFFGAQ